MCYMYVDILGPARQLSLEAVDRTLKKYNVMQAKVDKDPAAAASSLPS